MNECFNDSSASSCLVKLVSVYVNSCRHVVTVTGPVMMRSCRYIVTVTGPVMMRSCRHIVTVTSPVMTLCNVLSSAREVREQHHLTVSVNDGGTPNKLDYCHVVISVSDHNDHSPVFAKAQYNVTVSESATVGSSIVQLLATDRDAGINGYVTYTIVAGERVLCISL